MEARLSSVLDGLGEITSCPMTPSSSSCSCSSMTTLR